MFEARGLTIAHGRRVVFTNLSVRLDRGVTAVLGPNGAGKSTMLDAFATGRGVAGGEIAIKGKTVAGRRYSSAQLAEIGYMPQKWRFFSSFTVFESVEYVAWLKNVPASHRYAATVEALRAVNLEQHMHQRVAAISGGMKQRVGLAEAMVNKPSLVLLDEPTVGLDPAQRADFRSAIRAVADDRTVVLSTHLTDDVASVAQRVIVVVGGTIIFDGSPDSLRGQAVSRDPETSDLEAGYFSVLAANGLDRG
ncbi:ATP-binding cassette domain-containing protein [Microbacterium paludicola]|nr:ATP-binding cassette domain-containing protein [Microbacterium paludicola]